MHARVWEKFACRLATDFQVTCVDLPGHGRSPPWPRWGLGETAAALAALMPGPALWLGWSLGGQVAIELARRHPAKVDGLVLLSTTPRFTADRDWPGVTPAVFESFARMVGADGRSALARFVTLICQGTGNPREVRRRLQAAWGGQPAPAGKVLRQGLDLLRHTDLRCGLEAVRCPVAVVVGREDPLVPEAAAARLAADLPRARLTVLRGAAHVPFLTHPEHVAKIMCALS